MKNRISENKPIEQIRDESAQVYCDPDTQRVYRNGFSEAIQLCEQRERDLIDQIYKVQCTGPNQKEVLKELYRLADLYDQKHRGENDSKD